MADNSMILEHLLIATDPELADTINANWWASQEQIRGARVAKYRRYVTGDHDQVITDEMRDLLRMNQKGDGLNDYNDNYTRRIVDSMAGRIAVDQISTGTEGGDEWLKDLMDRSNFEALEGATYRASVRDGDAYLMVDTQHMRLTAEPAYNGHDGVCVIYGETDVVWACKLWSVSGQGVVSLGDADYDGTEKIIAKVYQPERITTWEARSGGTPTQVGEEDNWSAVGKVPVIPFVNQRDNYSSYGESEVRPALPLQDIINRLIHSMTSCIEYAGFPIRYAFGMKLTKMDARAGSFINVPVTDGGKQVTDLTEGQKAFMDSLQIGMLDGADMSQYVGVLDKLVSELSQSTQTPMYDKVGSAISGETLKQLEVGLVNKCERFQRENTDAWRKAVEIAHEVQSVYATPEPTPPAIDRIAVSWQSAQIRETNNDIAALVSMYKNAPNLFPDKWFRQKIGALLGLDVMEIQNIEEIVAETQADLFATLTGGDGSAPRF